MKLEALKKYRFLKDPMDEYFVAIVPSLPGADFTGYWDCVSVSPRYRGLFRIRESDEYVEAGEEKEQ